MTTGGRQATGGNSPQPGSAAGGTPATGGRQATGGEPATGGGASEGGKNAAGGTAATGGVTAAGGSVSAPAGGTAPTGGSKATGGTTQGTAGSSSIPLTKKFVGNITTGNSIDVSGMKYYKYWDQISPENQGKWGSVQPSASGAPGWSTLDSIYQYTQTNNIIFKQHTFVWGKQQPSGTPTLAQIENWIKSFCERYPNTKLIDVVNEPPPHTTPNYTANLGAGEKGSYPWIVKAFKLARQHCPNSILILNDYNNIENGDENNFIKIVQDIKTNGAPIDAVGAQAHGLKGMSGATVQSNLSKLNTQTGLPVYITEFDIDDSNDSSQSNSYQTLISMFLDASYVHGITVWGWIVGRTWESNSGIVRDTSPRPAMTWLMGKLGRPVPPN